MTGRTVLTGYLITFLSVSNVSTGWMSGPTFTPPSAEVAEMSRIHYDLEYTEGISQRMRIPETLKVAPEKDRGALPLQQADLPIHTALMQVPERIVVAGEDSRHDVSKANVWECKLEAGTHTQR